MLKNRAILQKIQEEKKNAIKDAEKKKKTQAARSGGSDDDGDEDYTESNHRYKSKASSAKSKVVTVNENQASQVKLPEEQLEKWQEEQKKIVPTKTWQTLEDLALKAPEDAISFKFVLQEHGREAVEARKVFLEVAERTAAAATSAPAVTV